MKIGLTLLFSRDLPFGGDFVAFVARLAEELGFDSIWLPEHIVIPASYESRYPYTKEGLPGDEQWPDPLACLTYCRRRHQKTQARHLASRFFLSTIPLELAKDSPLSTRFPADACCMESAAAG